MIIIRGALVSVLTFPGVIVHEAAHRFFCDIAKVPVYDVCYFRLGNPAGYVIHGETKDLKSSFLISIGPLLVNTLLCSILGFTAAFPLLILQDETHHWIFSVLFWIAISIGMHAFPSNQDMSNFINLVRETKKGGPLLIASWFLFGLFKCASMLRFFWFDAFYAVGVILFLPMILGLF
jgi:hypothetical protein